MVIKSRVKCFGNKYIPTHHGILNTYTHDTLLGTLSYHWAGLPFTLKTLSVLHVMDSSRCWKHGRSFPCIDTCRFSCRFSCRFFLLPTSYLFNYLLLQNLYTASLRESDPGNLPADEVSIRIFLTLCFKSEVV